MKKIVRGTLILGCSPLLWVLPAPACFAAPTSPLGTKTVSEFLIACRSNAGSCSDAVGGALLSKFSVDTGEVCLLSPNYAAAVPIWLGSHPETFPMATNDGIYMALKALYPC
jgi:hypothetical protein